MAPAAAGDGDWLAAVAHQAALDAAPELARYRVRDAATARRSAVLVLVADPPGRDRSALLLVRRSGRLARHPAEITFPGGSLAAGEDAVAAALRETREEVGLDTGGLQAVAALPALHLAWTNFLVHPVLARWPGRPPRPVPDGREVTAARWLPLAQLADPAARFALRYPTGYVSPAFLVDGMLVWGFTGSLIGWLLRLAGAELAWDRGRVEDLRAALARYGGGYGR
jgi:CoA pyrophosphatase